MYLRSLIFFFCNLCFAVTLINGFNNHERKPYIVYMGALQENTVSLADAHHNLLLEAIGNEDIARESKIHSYGRSFNALAARLLPHEAEILSRNENVVSVFPSQIRQLRTTRSWDFLGMPLAVTRKPGAESNIIVGLLDTGIYIPSKSFNDSGFGPPPSKWKGKCVEGLNFTGCNNKVIGAQYFNIAGIASPDQLSPADYEGHGTHTSSTAAGIAVPDASYYGIGKGTARGGVPSARIASYKVCWGIGCPDLDILAAFDAAIADGVDILSVSIGGMPLDYFNDSIAIGSFHAIKKGILVACAGGNLGPRLATIENVAPWIMTVAASTIDRKFETMVELGDGRSFSGYSSFDTFPMKQMYPLLNGARAKNGTVLRVLNVSACDAGSLDPHKVKGSILFCRGDRNQAETIKILGGAGTIMSSEPDIYSSIPSSRTNSSTFVNIDDGNQIDRYINSTKEAKAMIHKTRATFDKTAPLVAYFSSRGPQGISPNILKPDITAPGAAILAAYSALASSSSDPDDNPPYKFLSGTSMATPHAAAAAAYVKCFHPNWSPAAIRSAIMTTAKSFKAQVEGAELAYGSGEINPTKALHPGLIYDINVDSYISFLCREGYSSKNITSITGKKVNCSSFEHAKGTDGLNYPSMHIQLSTKDISAVFYRTVTYVGEGKSVFKAKIRCPKGLSITVSPNTLAFSAPYQQKSFNVTLNGMFMGERPRYLSGLLVWTDGRYSVRSPIFVSGALLT